MGHCTLCQHQSVRISAEIGLCLDCIRCQPVDAADISDKVHARIRREWGLPARAPRQSDGIRCELCVNRCQIGNDEWGYCGLRKNDGGRLAGVTTSRGKLTWYHDPLPTNCVGDWVCAGGTGCGYPTHAYRNGPEYGYRNLAVFPHACTFHCLYCQNWHFRRHTNDDDDEPVENLAGAVDKKTACICYGNAHAVAAGENADYRQTWRGQNHPDAQAGGADGAGCDDGILHHRNPLPGPAGRLRCSDGC